MAGFDDWDLEGIVDCETGSIVDGGIGRIVWRREVTVAGGVIPIIDCEIGCIVG
jgi:hypothetical protein